MTEQWVGFRSSPKRKPGVQVAVSGEWPVAVDLPAAVGIFTRPQGLAAWLGEVVKLDVRRGGKSRVSYEGVESGFTYAVYDLPRRFILVTERFGEVDAKIKHKQTPVMMQVAISRWVPLDEDAEVARGELQTALAQIEQASR